MNIKTLSLTNYRMFSELKIDFDPQCTLIIGKNGAGKSSVLEAVALAVSTLFYKLDGVSKPGFKKTDARRKYFPLGIDEDVQYQYPVHVGATASINGQDIAWTRSLNSSTGSITIVDAKEMTSMSEAYQQRLQKGDKELILPILSYYGTGRLWDYHREKRDNAFKYNTRTNGYINCLDGTANIKLMMSWFKKMTIEKYQQQELGKKEEPILDTVYRAMAKCMEYFSGYKDAKILYNLNVNELDVYYTNENGAYVKIPLSLMSDGYKEIISIVADIAYRMAVINPQLSENILTETDGIVMIDEIDLHLHPAWQQRVIESLTSIFPKVQFILTTHAPAVIGSVSSKNLRILENKTVKETINQTYGKDVNSILCEIMGADKRTKQLSDLFAAFYSLMDEGEYDAAEAKLDEIAKIRDYHDQEVAQCRVKLKLERIRGKF